MKTEVKLDDEVLLLLDGKCDPDTQRAVDTVKARHAAATEIDGLTEEQVAFVVAVEQYVLQHGRLGHRRIDLRYCKTCKASAGYAKYKSGPRTGLPNYDKPLSIYGVELAISFVSMRGYATLGCCDTCWGAIRPILVPRILKLEAEIPESLTGVKPRFKRYDMRNCTKCGWTGSERLMGRERTVLGDGTYPASCPECSAENIFMGPTVIKSAPGFELHPLT